MPVHPQGTHLGFRVPTLGISLGVPSRHPLGVPPLGRAHLKASHLGTRLSVPPWHSPFAFYSNFHYYYFQFRFLLIILFLKTSEQRLSFYLLKRLYFRFKIIEYMSVLNRNKYCLKLCSWKKSMESKPCHNTSYFWCIYVLNPITITFKINCLQI